MRSILIGLTLVFASVFAAPAQAQTSLTLHADPIPIVDATINGHPVRLEVDLLMPNILVLNEATARRLGVFIMPVGHLAIALEGSTRLRGRVARPRLVFPAGDSRALAGVFAVPVTSRADGVIGPSVLPYDHVTILLGPEPAGAHDMVFPLSSTERWITPADVGDLHVGIGFALSRDETVFNRPAARHFDSAGAIVSNGDLTARTVVLGLTTHMQPVRTELTALGFALAPTFARTDAPLEGAAAPDTIIVEAHAEHAPLPGITLGRAALAHCASISVDRPSRQLTLRCGS